MLNKIDPNFKLVTDVLDKNKITYWICHGTLLGIIRDKKFIDWDWDIDLAVWANEISKERISKILEPHGFKSKKNLRIDDSELRFSKIGGMDIDINFYNIKRGVNEDDDLAYAEHLIPRNTIMKLIDALTNADKYKGKLDFVINRLSFLKGFFKFLASILIKKKLFFKQAGYSQPLKLVNNLKKIDFNGIKISVPQRPEDYLEYVYGPKWRIPLKNWQWIKDSPSTVTSIKTDKNN